jgi:hypothetical protein
MTDRPTEKRVPGRLPTERALLQAASPSALPSFVGWNRALVPGSEGSVGDRDNPRRPHGCRMPTRWISKLSIRGLVEARERKALSDRRSTRASPPLPGLGCRLACGAKVPQLERSGRACDSRRRSKAPPRTWSGSRRARTQTESRSGGSGSRRCVWILFDRGRPLCVGPKHHARYYYSRAGVGASAWQRSGSRPRMVPEDLAERTCRERSHPTPCLARAPSSFGTDREPKWRYVTIARRSLGRPIPHPTLEWLISHLVFSPRCCWRRLGFIMECGSRGSSDRCHGPPERRSASGRRFLHGTWCVLDEMSISVSSCCRSVSRYQPVKNAWHRCRRN